MSEAIVKMQATEKGMSRDQIDLIKQTVAKGSTDDELRLFLYTAQRTGLDPLARQIHAVKRWNTEINGYSMTIQTGIDGYRLIAERTGKYAPGADTEFVEENGKIISAKASVKKLVGDTWFDVSATAYFSEYVQTKKDGKLTRMWEKMPHLMLAKCAEALVLRKAFPAELSGLYTHEEMTQADNWPEERKTEQDAKAPMALVESSEVEHVPQTEHKRKPETWLDRAKNIEGKVSVKMGKQETINFIGTLGFEKLEDVPTDQQAKVMTSLTSKLTELLKVKPQPNRPTEY